MRAVPITTDVQLLAVFQTNVWAERADVITRLYIAESIRLKLELIKIDPLAPWYEDHEWALRRHIAESYDTFRGIQ